MWKAPEVQRHSKDNPQGQRFLAGSQTLSSPANLRRLVGTVGAQSGVSVTVKSAVWDLDTVHVHIYPVW